MAGVVVSVSTADDGFAETSTSSDVRTGGASTLGALFFNAALFFLAFLPAAQVRTSRCVATGARREHEAANIVERVGACDVSARGALTRCKFYLLGNGARSGVFRNDTRVPGKFERRRSTLTSV